MEPLNLDKLRPAPLDLYSYKPTDDLAHAETLPAGWIPIPACWS